ncbi:hypothetical protein SUGI_0501250 [Cryptomeria japonica]|nr:hypothetical protein SUGI_0501250 [Cryptomeria japonica]
MEKHAGKRQRIEERNESRRLCKEPEASPPKRFCKDSNIDVVIEVMSMMDNEDPDEIEEEMVWDMMKMLQEEIAPSPSCSDDTGSSGYGSDELESSRSEECSFNAELDYLLGASDDELGIPGSPSVNTANDYDYDSCGFLESLEMEKGEQKLLLQIWLGYGESVEQDGSDVFSAHDLHIVSNRIESAFCQA